MAAPQLDITGTGLAAQLLQAAQSATLAAEAAATATKEVLVTPVTQSPTSAPSGRLSGQQRP